MNGLRFEIAPATLQPDPNRTDVACFVGFVARRNAPLPRDTRAALSEAGWVAGPWSRPEAEIEAALQVPIVVESWSAFDRIYAWDDRPIVQGGSDQGQATCTTYLGAAVRSFFAQGGRRAVIIRVADPWSYLESDTQREARLDARLQALMGAGASPVDPTSWRGMAHLFGLAEVTFVCLPDLPDLFASEPAGVDVAVEPPAAAEVFVACATGGDDAVIQDAGLRYLGPPRCTTRGYAQWRSALGQARERLVRYHREMTLIAALPLPAAQTRHTDGAGSIWAQGDFLGYLERSGFFHHTVTVAAGSMVASAFVQLAWPWLATRHSADLPARLEPPDGLLAGLLAHNALRRGTFRSAAGSRLSLVSGSEPLLSWSGMAETPADRLAERVCVVAPATDGWFLRSDVTASFDRAWRAGGVSRLFGALLRAARRAGASALFEASGQDLWSRIRRSLEQTLTAFWQEGGLGGATPGEAFSVRCDRSTMSQSDIDNGRVRAEVTVLPVAAVARITVVLDLSGGDIAAPVVEVA